MVLHWLADIYPYVDTVQLVFEMNLPVMMIVSDFRNMLPDLVIHDERVIEIILLLIKLKCDLWKTIKNQLPPTTTKKLMQQLLNKVKKN